MNGPPVGMGPADIMSVAALEGLTAGDWCPRLGRSQKKILFKSRLRCVPQANVGQVGKKVDCHNAAIREGRWSLAWATQRSKSQGRAGSYMQWYMSRRLTGGRNNK